MSMAEEVFRHSAATLKLPKLATQSHRYASCSDILESAKVLEANNFEDSPLPVENSATLDGVALSRSCILD